MGKTPEIVQVLREEEKLGKFKSSEDSTDFSYSPTITEKDLLFNAANDMFLYLDKKGIILDINKSGLDISGFEKSEVINKAFWKLTGIFSVKNLPKFMKVYKDALQGKITNDFICDLKNKFGKKYIMNFSTYPIFENSKLKKILVISKDISDEEKAKEKKVLSEKKFENIFNLSPSGIMIVDKKGNVQSWNKACEEIFGWKAEEVIGDFNPTVTEDMKDFYFKSMRKDSKNLEIKVLSKNKEFVDISLSTKPLFDDNNNFIGSLGVMTDITEQKKAEEELRENEARLRYLTDNMADIIWTMDLDFNTNYVSPSIEKVLGFTVEERKKQKIEEIVTPESLKNIKSIFKKKFLKEKLKKSDPNRDFTIEIEYYKKDGSTIWLENKVKWIRNNNGKITGMHGVSRDISERKQAEKTLKESEAKYKELFNNALVGIYIHNADGSLYALNKTAEEIFGLTGEELKRKDLSFWKGKLFKPDEGPMSPEEFPLAVVAKTKKPAEGVIVGLSMSKNENIRWFLHSARPILDNNGDINKIVTSFIDITDLRKSEEKFKNLFETMAEGAVYQNSDGKIIQANPAAEKILGLSLDQMQERTSMDPRWKAVDQNKNELPGEKHPAMIALKTGKTVYNFIQGIFNPKKNDYVWIIINSTPQFKEGADKPYQVYSTFLDITEKVKAEKQLKESEEKFRDIVELSPNGIATSDLKGHITSVNQSFLKLTGYDKEEIIGKHITRLPTIDFNLFPHYINLFKNMLQGKQKNPFEFKWKHKSGEIRWGECRYKVMKKNGKKIGVQVVLRDITDKRKSENEIRKFKTISDKAQYGVNLLTLDGNTIYVNQAFADMHGYKKEELIGKNHDILHTSEEKVTKVKQAREKLKNGEHVILEETHKKKDGTLIPVNVNASVIRDKKDKPSLITGIVTDLSKQKEIKEKLRESEKLFRTLVEQSTIGVYIHDPVNNKVLYANPLVRKVLGFTEKEFDEVDFFKYLHPDDTKLIKERIQKNLTNEHVNPAVEVRVLPPDGEMRWIRLYSTFIDYTGKKAAIASVVDITDSKKARDKEKEHLNKLERYRDTNVGRELRVVELKKEINKLCREQGLPIKYEDTENALKNDRFGDGG